MTQRNENGDIFISLKWALGILTAVLLSVVAGWASQRHAFESTISARVSVSEQHLSALVAQQDSIVKVLQEIRQDLRDHRVTGK